MSKLRDILANQSQLNNQIVEEEVVNGAPPKHDSEKPFVADSKQLAIQLIAELPIIPNNDNIAILLKGLGLEANSQPNEDVYKDWDNLIEKARDIFKSNNVLLSTSKLRSKIRILGIQK